MYLLSGVPSFFKTVPDAVVAGLAVAAGLALAVVAAGFAVVAAVAAGFAVVARDALKWRILSNVDLARQVYKFRVYRRRCCKK